MTRLGEILKALAEASACPYGVGDILQTFSDEKPSSRWPGTSWAQITDRFVYAAGANKAGATGGEANHTLTVDEMPSHGHKDEFTNQTSSAKDGYTVIGGYTKVATYNIGKNTGGNQPHNNMPPYVVAYMWKRTA